jgi:hypothetical protein
VSIRVYSWTKKKPQGKSSTCGSSKSNVKVYDDRSTGGIRGGEDVMLASTPKNKITSAALLA